MNMQNDVELFQDVCVKTAADASYCVVSHLDKDRESKLEAALASAEKCPYHSFLPEVIGPERRIYAADDQKHVPAEYAFEDAMLFPKFEWTCFCPKCADKSPFKNIRHNKFGFGYTSQHSWRAALSNWNKACIREYKRIIQNDLKKAVQTGGAA